MYSLPANVNDLAELATEIAGVRKLFEDSTNTSENLRKASELKEKVQTRFKGISDNPSKAIQELIVVKGNAKWGTLKKRVFIEPYSKKTGEVKGHWRKTTDANIKDKVRKWWNKNPKGKEDFKAKMKGVIVATDQIDTQWPWKWKILKAKADANTAAGYFCGSSEAQFLRFVAGAQVDSEFNLKEKKLVLTAHGDLSYSLAEGTISGSWSLPDRDGVDLFSLMRLNEKGIKAIKDGHECRMRLTMEAKGKAFTGASIAGSVALPAIDLSGQDKDTTWSEQYQKANQRTGYAEAGVDAFAGASLDGKLAASGEWRPEAQEKFDSLAMIQGVAAGSAGIGAGAKVQFGYKNGKLRFECGAMVVVGLGGKSGFAFEIGIDEGFELLAHIFYSVDYHYVQEVMVDAFEAFRDYSFAQFWNIGEISSSAVTSSIMKVKNFGTWLASTIEYDRIGQVKKFIRTNLNDQKRLRNAPPETLGGQVLRTIMATVEESDFDTIIKVLESARTDHELKWIIRCTVDYEKDDEDGKLLQAGIRALTNFGRGPGDAYKNYAKRLTEILDDKKIIFKK